MIETFFEELLNSRERRYEKQLDLIRKYNKPIISFMLNVPGIEKQNEKLVAFHKNGIEIIKDILINKIIEDVYVNEHTGMYYLAAINLNSKELKKIATDIENSDIGRLFDIDVFTENEIQLSRTSLGLSPRKCLLCDEEAKICMIKRKHSYEELIEKMNEIINSN